MVNYLKHIFYKIKSLFIKKDIPQTSSSYNVSKEYINYTILTRLHRVKDTKFKKAVIETIKQMHSNESDVFDHLSNHGRTQSDDFERDDHLSNRDQMQVDNYSGYSGDGGSFSGGGASGSWDSGSSSSDSNSRSSDDQ